MFEVSFTLHEAARATGVPAGTLGYFIKTGQLPTVKLGRTRVIRRQSLDAFLGEHETRVPEEGAKRISTGVVSQLMEDQRHG